MTKKYASFDVQQGQAARSKAEAIPQGGRIDARIAWLLIPFALVVVLLAGMMLRPAVPNSLGESHLAGPRPPTPVNVVVLRDDSGSFSGFEEMRNDAMAQVLAWAPGNLRDDYTITVVSFAGQAIVTMPTTSIAELAANDVTPSDATARDGRNTNLVPALRAVEDALARNENATSIVAITDTLVADTQSPDVARLLRDLNVTSMSVILPAGVVVNDGWADAFNWEAEFHTRSDDTASIALAVGQALAHATGQHLEPAGS